MDFKTSYSWHRRESRNFLTLYLLTSEGGEILRASQDDCSSASSCLDYLLVLMRCSHCSAEEKLPKKHELTGDLSNFTGIHHAVWSVFPTSICVDRRVAAGGGPEIEAPTATHPQLRETCKGNDKKYGTTFTARTR